MKRLRLLLQISILIVRLLINVTVLWGTVDTNVLTPVNQASTPASSASLRAAGSPEKPS